MKGLKILDYLAVKKFYAVKLAEDAAGTGRIESAFYHTMKMVYYAGVEDGEKHEAGIHAPLSEAIDNLVNSK